MPTIDFDSGFTRYYKVIRVYDGDTLTIETPIGTQVSLRLVGVNTPELNDSSPGKRLQAIMARDYLRKLVLNKYIFVTFEKSNTTLDGIARGPFCRPLAYVFIRGPVGIPLKKNIFVNLEIVWRGYGAKYFAYDFPYKDFFRLDENTAQKRINDLILIEHVQQAPQRRRNLPTVWGRLKSN